ncbi:hypothetical protein [Mycobacterium leprae]|uniref:hypothetical protein n=1 Tax=Mycobacterium leprae TaxID=1769 RepID=UPI0039BF06F9
MISQLMAAMANGDLEAVVLLFNPDIVFNDDSNSKVNKEIHVISGTDKVARSMFALARH